MDTNSDSGESEHLHSSAPLLETLKEALVQDGFQMDQRAITVPERLVQELDVERIHIHSDFLSIDRPDKTDRVQRRTLIGRSFEGQFFRAEIEVVRSDEDRAREEELQQAQIAWRMHIKAGNEAGYLNLDELIEQQQVHEEDTRLMFEKLEMALNAQDHDLFTKLSTQFSEELSKQTAKSEETLMSATYQDQLDSMDDLFREWWQRYNVLLQLRGELMLDILRNDAHSNIEAQRLVSDGYEAIRRGEGKQMDVEEKWKIIALLDKTSDLS